ncbi:hypothetical protein R1flu_018838 [Riccia fluitans]|uniref:Uncharacterized protein n=1 Tax=Riccia fluitans TaxID=41844 RepID=A0ABD1ZHB4_9MARC
MSSHGRECSIAKGIMTDLDGLSCAPEIRSKHSMMPHSAWDLRQPPVLVLRNQVFYEGWPSSHAAAWTLRWQKNICL